MCTFGEVLAVGMGSRDLSLQDIVLLVLAALLAAVIYWIRPDDDKEFWRHRGQGGDRYNINFYFFTFAIVYAILKALNHWKK